MVQQGDKELEKYGEPLTFDRSFKGPLVNRSCTDIFCLLIFVIFLGGWGFISYYAYTSGDLHKLLTPTDSFNRKCGQDSSVLNKPYLFFFNLEKCIDPLVPITGCLTHHVCVEKCPSETFIYNENLSQEEINKKLICLTEEDKLNHKVAVANKRCADWYVKSKPFLNRCIWEFSSDSCPTLPSRLLNSISINTNYHINKYYKRNKRDTFNSTPVTNSNINNQNNFNKKQPIESLSFVEETLNPLKTHKLEIIQNENNVELQHERSEKLHLIPIHTSNNTVKEKPTVFPAGLEVFDQKKKVTDNQNLKPVEERECTIRRILNDEIIIERVKETDTYLARFVGNFIAHFYPGKSAQDFGQKVVEDIIDSWPTIVIALIITMVVSLIFIALMRWIAAPVVWFSIIGVLLSLGVGIYFCVDQYIYYRDNPNLGYHSPNLKDQFRTIFEKDTTWLYISIGVSILLLIIFLLVIFLRKRIVIAIALVKEGSKAVSSVISSVFFPIFPWCLQILTLLLAISVGLYLASIGDPSFRVVGKLNDECLCTGPAVDYKELGVCDPAIFKAHCSQRVSSTNAFDFFSGRSKNECPKTGCYFEKINSPTFITYFHIVNVVGFFWLTFFISAFGEMVLAATFATWYWTFHKDDVPYFTTTKSLFRTIRYHLGTLALGSLIITICRIIRLILEYIDTKLKKYDNACTRAIMCCMKCFFYCLEKFLRFINRNAYIMCAIHGKNFCTSARDAFNLLMRNFLRVVTLDKVTDFLFFLSKLLISIGAGAATYYYCEHYYTGLDKLYSSGVPTAIVAIGTYLITSIFFGVYSMAVDTLFLCFLEDCERNDGSEEKPYFMSKQLMKILGRKNVIPRHQYRN